MNFLESSSNTECHAESDTVVAALEYAVIPASTIALREFVFRNARENNDLTMSAVSAVSISFPSLTLFGATIAVISDMMIDSSGHVSLRKPVAYDIITFWTYAIATSVDFKFDRVNHEKMSVPISDWVVVFT